MHHLHVDSQPGREQLGVAKTSEGIGCDTLDAGHCEPARLARPRYHWQCVPCTRQPTAHWPIDTVRQGLGHQPICTRHHLPSWPSHTTTTPHTLLTHTHLQHLMNYIHTIVHLLIIIIFYFQYYILFLLIYCIYILYFCFIFLFFTYTHMPINIYQYSKSNNISCIFIIYNIFYNLYILSNIIQFIFILLTQINKFYTPSISIIAGYYNNVRIYNKRHD